LIDQTTEAIVNPVNERLQHNSGAAQAIAVAAGKEFLDECEQYIRQCAKLRVGNVMHTTAGKLGPAVKYVINAAGPDARVIKGRKECYIFLNEIFMKCLLYSEDFLNIESLAMSAISAGWLGLSMSIRICFIIQLVSFTRKQLNYLQDLIYY